jgi:triacylglycerol esterase/lipase EstA (alpha/beta hydrolase family)
MGGLAIRAWMRAHGTARAALAVTLGTPHVGTQVSPDARARNGKQMVWHSDWLADLAASESAATRRLFRIALTPLDAIVFPQLDQVLPGVVPAVFEGLGHVQLCSNARVMNWVSEQLDLAQA